MTSVLNDPKKFLSDIFYIAVKEASPTHSLRNALPPPCSGRTIVIGAGKAAASMAYVVEQHWPKSEKLEGVVVTRYGHTPPSYTPNRIKVLEAAHPVPDLSSVEASNEIFRAVQGLSDEDQVIFLISGGASALLCLPNELVSFEEKQRINSDLLKSGAKIDEINSVRKHLSKIKGGQLAKSCSPARLFTLAISDVPGDEISIIGSGPTVPDDTTCHDAIDVLNRYNIDISVQAKNELAQGNFETPKINEYFFKKCTSKLIATPWKSLEAAAQYARSVGLQTFILSDSIEGESRDIGKLHAAVALNVAKRNQPFSKPCLILSGGETTVTIPKEMKLHGRGGRAGEFCLGLAVGLENHPDVWAIAADTDGIDGVENNAGAFVTPTTLTRAKASGIKINDSLNEFNSYGFFESLDDLLISGPTFTNVNDFRAILIL